MYRVEGDLVLVQLTGAASFRIGMARPQDHYHPVLTFILPGAPPIKAASKIHR